jgi:acetyl-CoA carboxylase biotin carboxyl carrier protein
MAAAAPAAAAPAAAVADPGKHPGAVPSPMVGTAYLAAEPGAAPFVEVGTRVAQGQTILIIEAMKTMNHIPAPKAAVVTAILVGNGQPVEFGEPLALFA